MEHLNKPQHNTRQEFRILLVGSSSDEIRDVCHILRKEYTRYISSVFEHEAVENIKRLKPDLIMVASSTITMAEDVIADIKRRIPAEQLPYTLLLCTIKESSRAYQLYRNGIIDYFVADRPLYDPYSVVAAVTQALNHTNSVKRISQEFGNLNKYFTDTLNSGNDKLHETAKTSEQVTRFIFDELNNLKTQLNAAGRETGILDTRYVNQQLTSLQETKLHPTKNHLLKVFEQQSEWLNEFRQGYTDKVVQMQIQPDDNTTIQVLLVDDDEFYREALETMFEDTHLKIEGVGSGKQALEYLQGEKPDLILLDYQMPGLNGLDLLQLIKKDTLLRDIPVIMLTGFSSREIVGNSIITGAADFIVKPGDRAAMISKIENITGKSV
ncbi:response regulator [uncultured Amphritea sp.]|uniref:response regulator n=1 Tax=uncultured Amphritea sp. TaxID=981605 RepID=UPI0025EADE06|nr:response regulator [uncultured Amphritea sp.]